MAFCTIAAFIAEGDYYITSPVLVIILWPLGIYVSEKDPLNLGPNNF